MGLYLDVPVVHYVLIVLVVASASAVVSAAVVAAAAAAAVVVFVVAAAAATTAPVIVRGVAAAIYPTSTLYLFSKRENQLFVFETSGDIWPRHRLRPPCGRLQVLGPATGGIRLWETGRHRADSSPEGEGGDGGGGRPLRGGGVPAGGGGGRVGRDVLSAAQG